MRGTATIEVTARNDTGTARQEFIVTVVTDPVEGKVAGAYGRSPGPEPARERDDGGPESLRCGGRDKDAGCRSTASARIGRTLPPRGRGRTRQRGRRLLPAQRSTQPGRRASEASAQPAGAGRLGGREDGFADRRRFMLALDAAPGEEHEDGTPRTRIRWTLWGAGDLQSFAVEPHREAELRGPPASRAFRGGCGRLALACGRRGDQERGAGGLAIRRRGDRRGDAAGDVDECATVLAVDAAARHRDMGTCGGWARGCGTVA